MPPFELSRLMPRAPWRRRAAAAALAAALTGVVLVSLAAPDFLPDAQPTGWVTRPALSSNSLTSGTETIFRADYKGGLWTGTVVARHIDANGNELTTSPWPLKDTAAVMAGAGATWWNTGRRIFTRTSAGVAVPFRLDTGSKLDNAQEAALGGGGTAQKLLNFVRGDRSEEAPSGSKLRTRYSLQGDTLHSTLLYWKHATTAGERRLYVGGNDGMLHAFDAANGSEVFAYVPSMLIPKLPKLAANPYVHTPFVDGGLAIADVTLSSGTRTLLAGALGGGGKGLFMLDVTNPTPAAESSAVAAELIRWEITPASTGFANLGYTYAAPRLARLNDGSAAVVVGNGYMNSGHGRASLLLIKASDGTLIKEIDTGTAGNGGANGLSTPTVVDTNRDGKADHAYAGDIDGNLWRFDLSSTNPADWSATLLLATQQAITVAPVVAGHPQGGRMVVFGTGRILSEDDISDSADHFVYGLWDGAPAANTSWLDQSYTEIVSGGNRLRTVTRHQPNWASGGHRGWRLRLPAGERLVGEGQFISDDRYYFTATDPTMGATVAFGADGANWFMEVDYLTGGAPAVPVFDVNADGVIDGTDNVTGAVVAGKYLGEGVSSQAVLADQSRFGQALFNRQSDIDLELPMVGGERGVAGGHFDVDFYALSGATSYANVKHTHQYDDKYGVTGVNFLNASDPTYNLGSKLASNVNFKVLVMNQYLNPASQFRVGPGAAYVSVKNYGKLATTADAAEALASVPTYNLGNVQNLAWQLPVDGFASKNWWGDAGGVRAGLIPSKTGCVKALGRDGWSTMPGPNGERANGAMTVQLIRDTTPASALELNHSGGDVRYGWRVKKEFFLTYVLAEYTMFWHHPGGQCYGYARWVPNPPTSVGGNAKGAKRASNSADSTQGTDDQLPDGVTVTSTAVTVTASTTTVLITYSDKKTTLTEITNNGNGTESIAVTDRNGVRTTATRMSAGAVGQAPDETLVASRRINWREVVRP